MTRRAAIAALALAALFAAVGARDAHAEWVTEVVTNRVEYDGVEYLESSGTQWIDTDIIIKSPCRIEATCYPIGDNTDKMMFGNRSLNNLATIWISTEGYWRFGNSYFNGNTSIMGIGSWHNIIGYPGTWIIDGETYNFGGEYDNESAIYSLYLFSANQLDNNKFVGRIAKCKIELSGYTKRDFIPVLDGTTPKMLNLVDGRLFANAGTGAFTYGAVTGKVAYVSVTTNRVYRAPAPMRSFDAAHPFNNAAARTRLGGTGSGEDGTTLRPSAHIDIKKNEEE